MVRLKLTIVYVGTAYAGWQIQAGGEATIQGELERALESIAGRAVRVHGAGRTDSGVHADCQVAHADVPGKNVDWARALNAKLPYDIRILTAEEADPGFHARLSATGKLYAYSLFCGPGPVPPRLEPFVWKVSALDPTAMEDAAAVLTGRHDFASFQNVGTPVADTVRHLRSIRRESGRLGPFCCPPDWPVETWFFHGDGFLKQMVRNLVGLLVWAGGNRIDSIGVAASLAARNRQAVPSPTAPAKGLSLSRVEYFQPLH